MIVEKCILMFLIIGVLPPIHKPGISSWAMIVLLFRSYCSCSWVRALRIDNPIAWKLRRSKRRQHRHVKFRSRLFVDREIVTIGSFNVTASAPDHFPAVSNIRPIGLRDYRKSESTCLGKRLSTIISPSQLTDLLYHI